MIAGAVGGRCGENGCEGSTEESRRDMQAKEWEGRNMFLERFRPAENMSGWSLLGRWDSWTARKALSRSLCPVVSGESPSAQDEKEGTVVLVGQDMCFTCLSEKRVLAAGGRCREVLAASEGHGGRLSWVRGPVEKRRS